MYLFHYRAEGVFEWSLLSGSAIVESAAVCIPEVGSAIATRMARSTEHVLGFEPRCLMRREVITAICYSHRSKCESCFRLTYEVREGRRPGMEQWFLVGMEELAEFGQAA